MRDENGRQFIIVKEYENVSWAARVLTGGVILARGGKNDNMVLRPLNHIFWLQRQSPVLLDHLWWTIHAFCCK